MAVFVEQYYSGFPKINNERIAIVEFKKNKVEFKLKSLFNSDKIVIKSKDIIAVAVNGRCFRSKLKASRGFVIEKVLKYNIECLAGVVYIYGMRFRKKNYLYLVIYHNNSFCEIVFKESQTIHDLRIAFEILIEEENKKLEQVDDINTMTIAEELEQSITIDGRKELENDIENKNNLQ